MAHVQTRAKPFGQVPANTVIRWGNQWMEVGSDRLARPLVPNEPTGLLHETALGIALAANITVGVMR